MLPWCRERPQTAICCLEWLGRLKCLVTSLDVFLLSFSMMTQRCSWNRSPSRLPVLLIQYCAKVMQSNFVENSWLFGAFQRNFALHDISSTNRDSLPHFRCTYCLEWPNISRCRVVCCDLSRDNSLLVKVGSELSWEDLSAFEPSSQWRKYETRFSISLLRWCETWRKRVSLFKL